MSRLVMNWERTGHQVYESQGYRIHGPKANETTLWHLSMPDSQGPSDVFVTLWEAKESAEYHLAEARA